jgi:hypothetical protein
LVSPSALVRTLGDAKKRGCIGVIIELVQNQAGGRVLKAVELRNLREACSETSLLLGADEALTAIRCGAPFAYQRPEYMCIPPPDLVFFGKALVANGVAIRFDAPFTERLAIRAEREKRNALQVWQYTGSQALQLPLLISALGALEMAVAGDWVGRSETIGRAIRELVRTGARECGYGALGDDSPILGGLGAFIFVRMDISAPFLVMVATNGGPSVGWVRWLPRLDQHLTSETVLASILSGGASHRGWRRRLSAQLERVGLAPEWCFWCGNHARNDRNVWCRACCVNACDVEACLAQLQMHRCLDSPQSTVAG